MVILDLQRGNIVNDPGFIYYSNTLDPHYKIASDKFYRGLLSKSFEKGVKNLKTNLRRMIQNLSAANWMDGLHRGMVIYQLKNTWLEKGQLVLGLCWTESWWLARG